MPVPARAAADLITQGDEQRRHVLAVPIDLGNAGQLHWDEMPLGASETRTW